MLRYKAFNIAKNPKYDGYQRGLATIVYIFFNKKSAAGTHKGTRINSDAVFENQQLAEELDKSIKRKFEKRKVYSSFKDNIWDLADMQLISKYNKGFRFLLCVTGIYSKWGRDWGRKRQWISQ